MPAPRADFNFYATPPQRGEHRSPLSDYASVIDREERPSLSGMAHGALSEVLESLKREGPMALAGFIPGGRFVVGGQLMSDAGEAEAGPLRQLANGDLLRRMASMYDPRQLRALQEGALDARLPLPDYLNKFHPTEYNRVLQQFMKDEVDDKVDISAAGSVGPLAKVVAARMIGQLEGVKALPGLSALERTNLPAAYAGDQRSLQAVQRAINKSETGIESPGRRKFMKQSAATAARQAIPEAVNVGAGMLGRSALKESLAPVVLDQPLGLFQGAPLSLISLWRKESDALAKAMGLSDKKSLDYKEFMWEEINKKARGWRRENPTSFKMIDEPND